MRSARIKKIFCTLAMMFGIWAGALADDWYSEQLAKIPQPHATVTENQTISLKDAILLALRNNPNVEAAELARVSQKYSLMMEYNTFFPQYTLSSDVNVPSPGNGKATYSINPGLSIQKTPIGTSIDTSYSKDFTGGPGQGVLTIKQPLLRGFGVFYNTFALENKKDEELKNQLDYKSNIMTAVNTVIKDYRSLVEDYNSLTIQKRTLKQNELQYQQDVTRVKSGTMSRSDLIEAKATLTTFRLNVVQTENSVQQDQKTLLNNLGLSPNIKFKVDKNINLPAAYKPPTADYAIAQAYAGNIDYLKRLIDLRITERKLKKDKMDLWWKLDLTVNNTWGYNGTQEANNSPNFNFKLTVPINNFAEQEVVLNDRINLINAQNRLAQARRTLNSNITQEVQNIESQLAQVKIAEEQVKLQQMTVNNTQLKIKYGKAAMFELTTQQNTLLTNQTSLVRAKITLLNTVTNLNTSLGLTLKVWGIHLRY